MILGSRVPMSRFVILTHDHPFLHWDLLIEAGTACRTWRLLADPGLPQIEFPAEALPDHRLLYLDYEGPVSGNRGTVTRWDHGTADVQVDEPDDYCVLVRGHRWQGNLRLQKIAENRWTLMKTAENDGCQSPGNSL